MDPGMRDALDQLGAELRREIRTSAEEGRVYVDGSIRGSAAETRAYINERLQATSERLDATTSGLVHEIRESESRMRRHFEVVGESLRGDIRGVAEFVALSSEASQRRDDGLAERTDRRG